VFSAWIGDDVLGSRAEPISPAGASAGATVSDAVVPTSAASTAGVTAPGIEARSVSFLLDPATGASRPVAGDGIWRPVLDPTRSFAVYWSGTIEVDPNGLDWRPANGTLVLARWDPTQLVAPVSPSPSPVPSGAAPSASPAAPVALLASGPVGDWDARWDESGTYLGLWVSDRAGSQTGKLTLHTVDLATGALDAAGALLTDQSGQPGFSLAQGRLAWVAPDGVTGSVVKVYAWAGAKGGTAQTTVQPGDTLVIH
jgi:hypothetical protein